MSRLLVDEEFIAVQPALVRALGGKVVDALVLQYLHFWLRVSDNQHEGHRWVYNTYQDWSNRLGVSIDQARRSIERLENLGVVLSCQPNAGTYDQRKWYRIDYGHSCLIDLANLPDGSGDSANSSIYTERTNREHFSCSPSSQSLTITEENITSVVNEKTIEAPDLSQSDPITSEGTKKPAGRKKRASKDDNPDPEVIRLCNLLADLVHANGNTRPNPDQKKWYAACRLLLTKDGPDGKGWPPERVETMIRWVVTNDFWRPNVMCMPTLRDKFDRLRDVRNTELKRGKSKDTQRAEMGDKLDDIIKRGESEST